MLKMISWNVNGLRAVLKKDFMTIFNELDADWFCLQETKMQAGQVELDLPGYYQYFNYAERKGYSGTAIFTKHKPLNVTYGMGIPEHDTEGRIITLEYPKFYLMTVYTPNSGGELKRLDYRQQWDRDFLAYTNELAAKKPLVYCGDLNVAHEPIDLKNDKTNHHNAGFTDEERADFLPNSSIVASLIRSAIFTRIRSHIPGGVIASTRELTMPAGGLIILSPAQPFNLTFRMLRF